MRNKEHLTQNMVHIPSCPSSSDPGADHWSSNGLFYLPLCTWHIKSYIVLSIHPLFCFSFEMCYWHFCPLWPICLPSCILFNGKTVLHPEMVGDLIPPLSRAVLQISKPFKCASKSALSPFNARHQIAQFHFLAFLNLHQNV